MVPQQTYAAPGGSVEERAGTGADAAGSERERPVRAPHAGRARVTGRLYATERAVLRARVVRLEWQLARKERQLDAVIDRYERLLSEEGARTHVDGGAVEIEFGDEPDDSGGVLDAVRDWLR